MPHISKKQLSEKLLDDIRAEFVKTLLTRRYRNADVEFITEFFTKTERLMFAKRLAVMVFLLKGVPPYHIQQKLGMSPSTIARIQLGFETGRLKRTRKILSTALAFRGFWEDLAGLLQEGFSQRPRKRSAWLHDNLPPE